MKAWFLERITEQGTWRGLIMLAGGLAGFELDSGVSNAISMLCAAISAAGLHNIVTKG